MPNANQKKLYRSVKGVLIDMDAMRRQNQYEIAIGNANMNARGDLLGKGGQIVKTKEQLQAEYNKSSDNNVRQVSIRDALAGNREVVEKSSVSPEEMIRRIQAQSAYTEQQEKLKKAEHSTAVKHPGKSRKIVDSE